MASIPIQTVFNYYFLAKLRHCAFYCALDCKLLYFITFEHQNSNLPNLIWLKYGWNKNEMTRQIHKYSLSSKQDLTNSLASNLKTKNSEFQFFSKSPSSYLPIFAKIVTYLKAKHKIIEKTHPIRYFAVLSKGPTSMK